MNTVTPPSPRFVETVATQQPDIFKQMTQLFRGESIEGGFINCWVLHRFFASDPAFAPSAKEIGLAILDDELSTGVWAVSVPRMAKAPFFKFAAPKKPPASVALSKKIAEIENLSAVEADEVVGMFDLMKVRDRALRHYGIDDTAKAS